MKRALSIILAFALMLSTIPMLALTASAADEGEPYIPSGYNGTLGEEADAGFEDATWRVCDGIYKNGQRVSPDYSGVTSDESMNGKSSLYVDFAADGSNGAFASFYKPTGSETLANIDAAKDYIVTANIKTTENFLGAVMVYIYFDGVYQCISNKAWYGESYVFDNTTDGSYDAKNVDSNRYCGKTYSDWTAVRSDCVYGNYVLSGSEIAKKISGSTNFGYIIMVRGKQGAVWIDDLDVVPQISYDGSIAEYNDGSRNYSDGGFETNYRNQWTGNNNDTNGRISDFVKTDAHSGLYSLKFTADSSKKTDNYNPSEAFGLEMKYPVSKIATGKEYYLEAWVKLDPGFTGKVYALVCSGLYGTRAMDDYASELYLLGSNTGSDIVASENSRLADGWVQLRTSPISASELTNVLNACSNNGSSVVSLCLYMKGSGTVYIDDVDFKQVTDTTPIITTPGIRSGRSFDGFNSVRYEAAAADTDIYYTTDGTDPRTSRTAALLGINNYLLTQNTLIRAVGFKDGSYSNVYGSYFMVDSGSMPLNGRFENSQGTGWNGDYQINFDRVSGGSLAMSIPLTSGAQVYSNYDNIDGDHDYNVGFDLATVGISGGDVKVKLFLAGEGIEQITLGTETYNGTFADNDGILASVSADQEYQHYSYKIENIDGKISGFMFVVESTATAGTAYLDQVVMTSVQKVDPVIKVTSTATQYRNVYYGAEAISLPVALDNNSNFLQSGILRYELVKNGKIVTNGSLTIEGILAGDTENRVIPMTAATEYGVYQVNYSYTDTLGRTTYPAVSRFSRAETSVTGTTGITSHLTGSTTLTQEECNTYINGLFKAGIGYLRIDVLWSQVEQQAGSYAMPATIDTIVNTANSYGIQPIVIFGKGNPIYSCDNIPDTAEKRTAFVNYASFVTEHFGTKVSYYECYNEPNLILWSAENYANLVKALYPAVKAKNADAKVVAGTVSGNGRGYLEGMVEKVPDIAQYFNIWAVHPYTYKSGAYELTEDNAYFNNIKSTILGNIPIWVTEVGWPTSNGQYGYDQQTAAANAIRSYVAMQEAGIQNVVVYQVDDSRGGYYTEANFGIYSSDTAKDSYVTLAAYHNRMDGFTYSGKIGAENPSVYNYKFTDADGRIMHVLWSAGDTVSYTINLELPTAVLYDMYGNKQDFNGTIDLTGEPVYLVEEQGEKVPFQTGVIGNNSFEDGLWMTSEPNDSRTIELDSANGYSGNQSAKIHFDSSDTRVSLLHSNVDSAVTSQLDLTTKYYFRVALKASGDYKGLMYFRTKESSKYQLISWATERMVLGANATDFVSAAGYWKTYDSPAFAITGDKLDIELCVAGESGTIWIDEVQLLPVSQGAENGKVTAAYNAESSSYTVTVTADKGYRLSNLAINAGTLDISETVTLSEKEKVSVPVTVYTYNMPTSDVGTDMSYTGFQTITASFTPINTAAIVRGDANYDKKTDIRDLVRVKRYLAHTTNDIELLNVDYNSDDYVLAQDMTDLRKQLIGITG